MDPNNPSEKSERIRRLSPPKSNSVSMVLNGAGNGMMLGGIPYLVSQAYGHLANKPLSRSLKVGSEFAVVAGSVIGAVYGVKEAKELKQYREDLKDELADLRAEVDRNSARVQSWVEKEEGRVAPTPAASSVPTR